MPIKIVVFSLFMLLSIASLAGNQLPQVQQAVDRLNACFDQRIAQHPDEADSSSPQKILDECLTERQSLQRLLPAPIYAKAMDNALSAIRDKLGAP